jgi:hypothetical protein
MPVKTPAEVLASLASQALIAMGKKREAINYAESCRGPWASDGDIDALCEQILMSSGLVDEAYRRYGLRAHIGGTYLATFRAVAKAYPGKQPQEILADLVETTPGEEGKWFAAAKEAGLYDEALDLARRAPCDPKTLARAARDLDVERPAFAAEAGLLALHWLSQGYGYEITGGGCLGGLQLHDQGRREGWRRVRCARPRPAGGRRQAWPVDRPDARTRARALTGRALLAHEGG